MMMKERHSRSVQNIRIRNLENNLYRESRQIVAYAYVHRNVFLETCLRRLICG